MSKKNASNTPEKSQNNISSMSRHDFLLLPQRKYKGILGKMPSGSSVRNFEPKVDVSKKKSKYKPPIDVTAEGSNEIKIPTIANIFRSEDKIFDTFIKYFEPKEVYAIASTSQKTYRHIIQYPKPLVHKISLRAFLHILKYNSSGILHHAHLLIGSDEGDPCSSNDTNLLLSYMNDKLNKKLKEKKMKKMISTGNDDDDDDDATSHFKIYSIGLQLRSEVLTDQAHEILASISTSTKMQHLTTLSFEGSAMDSPMFIYALNCFKGAVWGNLNKINLSHNGAYYTAVHKLQVMLRQDKKYLPLLDTIIIASTGAEVAAMEFFDYKFLKARPKLTSIDISGNNVNLLDSDASKLMARCDISFGPLKHIDLSFNPLADDGMLKILRSALPIEYESGNPNKPPDTGQTYILDRLICQNSQIGDGCMLHLVELIKLKRFTNLTCLQLSMNHMTKYAARWIIEPLQKGMLPSLVTLGLGMNNLGDDGMIRFSNCMKLGTLDQLEELDIAQVGAGINNINLFAANIIERDNLQQPPIMKLKVLKLYGKQPFIGKKAAKIQFPPRVLERINIS